MMLKAKTPIRKCLIKFEFTALKRVIVLVIINLSIYNHIACVLFCLKCQTRCHHIKFCFFSYLQCIYRYQLVQIPIQILHKEWFCLNCPKLCHLREPSAVVYYTKNNNDYNNGYNDHRSDIGWLIILIAMIMTTTTITVMVINDDIDDIHNVNTGNATRFRALSLATPNDVTWSTYVTRHYWNQERQRGWYVKTCYQHRVPALTTCCPL